MFDESKCQGCAFEGLPADRCKECVSCIKGQLKAHIRNRKSIYESNEKALPVIDDREIESFR